MQRFLFSLFLTVVAMLLAACTSSPPVEQFYTLTTESVSPVSTVRPDALAVSIGAIHLPEQVDRPQIVTLDGEQRVVISEQHRWAASLQAQIGQVLASGLAQRLDTALVTAYPQPEPRSPDLRITFTVQRFQAQPGHGVVVDALWTIRATQSEKSLSGHAQALAPIALTGDNYADIAAAYRTALDEITQQVAKGIRSFQQ